MKKLFYLSLMLLFAVHSFAQNCAPAASYDYLDINNVKARINNGGDMWSDLENEPQYIVPKTGTVSAFWAGALWIAGVDPLGSLHVAAQTYRQTGNDFFPGPLDETGAVTNLVCDNFDRIWKVNRSTIDSFNASQFTTIPVSISEWPGRGNPNLSFLPDQELAPFIDMNSDGFYNSANGDYPDIPGDQALWFVFNDKGNIHSESGGSAIGIEVQATVYAFTNAAACLENTTFYHYKILNKWGNNLSGTYVGLWADTDLGCPSNDYVGCDTTNNLGIVYNAVANDTIAGCIGGYEINPPVVAIDFLKGPQDGNGNTHYMDHFIRFQNDFGTSGNPENATDYYNLLQSIYKGGNHLLNPQGEATDFGYPGDPSDPNGWSLCQINAAPVDERIVMSAGPFDFNSGDVQTLDFSVVWDNTSVYPCPSFSTIIDVSNCADEYFKTNVQFTGVVASSKNLNLATVFPNPISQQGTIAFHLRNATQIRIFDISGKEVVNVNVEHLSVIQLTAIFGQGIYIYEVLFADQSVNTGKLVVQ